MHAPPTRRWRWLAGSAITLAVALPATAGAATQTQIDAAVSSGAAWIADQQDKTSTGTANPSPTGGLPGFNGNWAVTSLAASGIHAADVQRPGVPKSLQQYVFDGYTSAWGTLPNTNSAGNFGREALIAGAAGIQITKLAPSTNLTASLASRWKTATGSFGAFAPNSDGFALLAADHLRLPAGVRRKIDVNLRAAQKTTDGGWTFSAASTGTGDIDMTGAVLSMLCQNGATTADPAVVRGVAFLNGKLNPETGGFGTTTVFGIPPSNAPGSSWALTGLRDCGVDPQSAAWTTPNGKNPVQALLDLQRASGSFRYVATTGEVAGGTDMNSTEAAVRALAGHGWAVPAPVRVDPTAPRLFPAPTVIDGTTVPVALSVDPGDGDVRFCAVQVLSGSPLTSVLETARSASVPAGCVDDFGVSGPLVTTINGDAATNGAQWQVRFANGAPSAAAQQAVRFGDVVALELVRPLSASATDLSFDAQPQATISPARTVTLTASQDGVALRRTVVSGTNADDFVITRDECADATLNENESCTVAVRFAPSATGVRLAALHVRGDAGTAVSPTVNLSGTGGELPKGETGDVGPAGPQGESGAGGTSGSQGEAGLPGATGAIGPIGAAGATGATGSAGAKGAPGPKGAKGQKGTAGQRGATGKTAAVTCRVSGKRVQRVRCTIATPSAPEKSVSKTTSKAGVTVNRTAKVRLTRLGRTYATGTARTARATLTTKAARRITRGSYTLRIGTGKTTENLRVTVR